MELDINLVVNKVNKGISLKRKLLMTYVLVAVISTFLISITANVLFENQFKDYVIKNQKSKNNDILLSVKNAYSKQKWNLDVLENVGMDAMQYGMILTVYDFKGNKLWDAREYNNGICEAMITHMSQNMMKHYNNFKGGYVEKSNDLFIDSKKIGRAVLGYYGPYYYTDNDLIFISTFNKIIISVGIISLIFAIIIGIIIAGSITRPILRAIKAAKSISKGRYSDRIDEKSGITEINDLTDTINNLTESLENQEKLRKKLTGDVAHELRTPLATLQTHLEAIVDGVWEPTIERISSCHEEVTRINRMVGDLEKLAKYDNESLTLNKSNFNLKELVEKILMNFEGEFLNKNITLTFNGEHTEIFADKDKMTQVVVNLISNALKYTPENGAIDITLKEHNNIVEFKVKDNGIGISEEDLPNIFERFYRADKSRSRQTGGAGIGLTITKSIVEAHGGEIQVRSKLNEGSEFILELKK